MSNFDFVRETLRPVYADCARTGSVLLFDML